VAAPDSAAAIKLEAEHSFLTIYWQAIIPACLKTGH